MNECSARLMTLLWLAFLLNNLLMLDVARQAAKALEIVNF